jgi:hypothetical protein
MTKVSYDVLYIKVNLLRIHAVFCYQNIHNCNFLLGEGYKYNGRNFFLNQLIIVSYPGPGIEVSPAVVEAEENAPANFTIVVANPTALLAKQATIHC